MLIVVAWQSSRPIPSTTAQKCIRPGGGQILRWCLEGHSELGTALGVGFQRRQCFGRRRAAGAATGVDWHVGVSTKLSCFRDLLDIDRTPFASCMDLKAWRLRNLVDLACSSLSVRIVSSARR